MNIIIPSVHLDQDIYLRNIFVEMGHNVYFVKDGLDFNPLYPTIANYKNTELISVKDINELENLCVLSQCVEHENEVYNKIISNIKGVFVIHVYGNNISESEQRKNGRVPFNMIALDIQSEQYFKSKGCKNICKLRPGILNELYPFREIDFSKSPVINSYIQEYQHPIFITNYNEAKDLEKSIPNVIFNYFGSGSTGGFLMPPEIAVIDINTAQVVTGNQIDELYRSYFTLHIKRWEGYGFNIVKSMAIGRPVVCLRKYIEDKTCREFLIDGKTAVVGDSISDLSKKIQFYLNNPDKLKELSINGHKHIMAITNKDSNIKKMKIFMDGLI